MSEAANEMPTIDQLGICLNKNCSTINQTPRARGQQRRSAAIKCRQHELVKVMPRKQMDVRARTTAQIPNAPDRAIVSRSKSVNILGIKKKYDNTRAVIGIKMRIKLETTRIQRNNRTDILSSSSSISLILFT